MSASSLYLWITIGMFGVATVISLIEFASSKAWPRPQKALTPGVAMAVFVIRSALLGLALYVALQ